MAISLIGAAPALAGDEHDDGPSTSATVPPEGIGIDQQVFVSGAEVSLLEGGEERTMGEYEAAVFMQSWVAAGYWGGPDIITDLPPDLPVYRIDFSGTWLGQKGNVTAYYATDGVTPFVSFPGLAVWTDPSDVVGPDVWFTPPARTIDAFNGDAELIETAGVQQATSIPPAPEDAAGATEGTDSDVPWPWVGAGVAAATALIGGLAMRRRRSPAADGPA